jgi:hypothetical protein
MRTHDQAVIDQAVKVMASTALWDALYLYSAEGISPGSQWPVAMTAELKRRGEIAGGTS